MCDKYCCCSGRVGQWLWHYVVLYYGISTLTVFCFICLFSWTIDFTIKVPGSRVIKSRLNSVSHAFNFAHQEIKCLDSYINCLKLLWANACKNYLLHNYVLPIRDLSGLHDCYSPIQKHLFFVCNKIPCWLKYLI